MATGAPPSVGGDALLPLLSSGNARQTAERSSAQWAAEERERLRFVNRFVLSLYEDLGALLQANEATQLKKIKLLCMQAVQDMSKLNEYVNAITCTAGSFILPVVAVVRPSRISQRQLARSCFGSGLRRVLQAESMKPLFDRDFFAYLLTAIQEERRRIACVGVEQLSNELIMLSGLQFLSFIGSAVRDPMDV